MSTFRLRVAVKLLLCPEKPENCVNFFFDTTIVNQCVA